MNEPLSEVAARRVPAAIRARRPRSAVPGALVGLLLAWQAEAGVVGTGIPGSCTQAALDNRIQAGGIVTFSCGALPVTIPVNALFILATNPTVEVDGGGLVTLDGTGFTNGILEVGGNSSAIPDVTFRRITFANGHAAGGGFNIYGGAIRNWGKLTLDTVNLSGNTAGQGGGAIFQHRCTGCPASSTSIRYSSVATNTATAGYGGAIHVEAGTLNVLETSFSNNSATVGNGGAIYFFASGGAPAGGTISNGHFSNNSAAAGGAIWAESLPAGASVSIDSSTFASNSAIGTGGTATDGPGGAIGASSADLTISGSLFQQNQSLHAWSGALWTSGATIAIQDSTFKTNSSASGGSGAFGMSGSTVTIRRSTFSGNTANGSGFGGAIAANGTVGIENSTISGNVSAGASGSGGAMYVQAGTTDLRNVTITLNSANSRGGVYVAGSGTLTMRNSILAGNLETGSGSGNAELLVNGSFTSNGYNLLGSASGITTGTGDVMNASPGLGVLANNGGPNFGNVVVVGPTFTHVPTAGSPVIDAGEPSGCLALGGGPLMTDQRNQVRPSGGRCDIGGVEVQVASGPAAKLAFVQQPTNAVAGAAIAPAVTVQVQDAGSAAVAQAGVQVTVALGSGTGTLSGTATQATNASGIAMFSGLSVSVAGTKTLSASSTGLTGAASDPFVISTGAATSLTVTGGNSQSATVGTVFGAPLQVLLTDGLGNPVPGAQVTFTAPGSGASASLATSPATTDAAGHAQVAATANGTTGSYSVTASTGTLPSVSFSLTNTAPAQSNNVPALGTTGLVLLALALSAAGARLLGRGGA